MTIGIAVFNQKGGAGKTTVTVNLAAAFASQGASVLVCDLDGQASLSSAVGLDETVYTDPEESIYTFLITKQGDPNRMVLQAPNDDFDVLPGDTRTYMADIELLTVRNRELRLTRLFKKIRKRYDFILVDCPPHLGVISDNALMACRHLLVPARMQHTYMRRFDKLMEQIDDLEDEYDVRIGLIGVVPVAYLGYPDEKAYLEALKAEMPGGVAPELRWRDTAIEEARTQGYSVFSYKPAKKHREESLRKMSGRVSLGGEIRAGTPQERRSHDHAEAESAEGHIQEIEGSAHHTGQNQMTTATPSPSISIGTCRWSWIRPITCGKRNSPALPAPNSARLCCAMRWHGKVRSSPTTIGHRNRKRND